MVMQRTTKCKAELAMEACAGLETRRNDDNGDGALSTVAMGLE